MKYLMRSVKRAVEAVGIWTEDNWDAKKLNSSYNMVSGRFNFKINKRFDSLSWSSVVRYFYTWRGCIIGELNLLFILKLNLPDTMLYNEFTIFTTRLSSLQIPTASAAF